MPARCGSCGEEALTETARFCIGCGAALPEVDPGEVVAELVQSAPPEPPPPTPHLSGAQPQTPPRVASRPPRLAPPQPRDLSPLVPLPLVVAGVIGILALLLILLLAA